MVLKSNFYCSPYLKNIIQSYVSKTLPCCSQNIGCFLYLVLLISLNLGIFHQSILLFFTHFFKLFLCIFKFPNISMEKRNMDNKFIPKHEKEFKATPERPRLWLLQLVSSSNFIFFNTCLGQREIHKLWQKLPVFLFQYNWTQRMPTREKLCPPRLRQLQYVIRSVIHPIATFLQLDLKPQWFGVIFYKALIHTSQFMGGYLQKGCFTYSN